MVQILIERIILDPIKEWKAIEVMKQNEDFRLISEATTGYEFERKEIYKRGIEVSDDNDSY